MSLTVISRGLAIVTVVLSLALCGATTEAAETPWPLVNAADHAVWGTLVHISAGSHSRLIVVRPLENDPDAGSQPPVRLVDRVGNLPDGTTVWPGQQGLFLYTTDDTRESEFASIDGTLLVGGVLLGNSSAEDRERITRLVSLSVTDDESEGQFTAADALALLASEWAPARDLALGWWRDRGPDPDRVQKAQLDAGLRSEPDGARAGRALAVYLRRHWAIPTGGLTTRLCATRDPVFTDLAIRAIELWGGAREHADLLLAWPDAEPAARIHLLHAYAGLRIEESSPWWQEALISADPELRTVALRQLGRAAIPGAIEAYRAVLDTDDPRLIGLALEGLALCRTPQAIALLREFHAERETDDPLARKAERLLRNPRRYGARPPRPSPLEGEGR